jgi:hypothetical protein
VDCDVSNVVTIECVISDSLGVPDVTKSGWFRHSTEKLETIRPAYSKCKHFESSGIGITKAEKQKLRSWKKQCVFCKVSKRPRSEEREKEESDSHDDDQKLTSKHDACALGQQMQHAPNSSSVRQAIGWLKTTALNVVKRNEKHNPFSFAYSKLDA